MLFLTEADVRKIISVPAAHGEAVAVIEQVLRQQSEGSTHQLKRTTMAHPDHPGHLWHNIRILPAMVPGIGAAAVRVYSGYRGTNQSEVICLFDWSDMRMIAIISDSALHPVRTAAPYGVAAKHLARADAATLGIIGTGRYARSLAQAVCSVRPIRSIRAWSRDPANVGAYCERMSRTLGIEVLPAASGRDAVRGCDIMITATSGNTIVFEAGWLEPGALLMSLAPGEFDEQTVLRSRVIVSAPDQVLGDTPPRKPFSSLVDSGRFGRADIAADLSDVVAGKSVGRTGDADSILYACPGMGILDAGIGRWVFDRAVAMGIGTEMPFGEEVGEESGG
jgi:ornithine cyclodeaminase/alanine dehydrogenase-like protein (mu-crystallin family)